MGKQRLVMRGLSVLLIMVLLTGLAPGSVWAEVGNELSDTLAGLQKSLEAEPETWVDGPDKTIAPTYYTFSGEQVLESRPDMGPDRVGAGGTYLAMNDTPEYFSVDEGQVALSWNDTLQEWIAGQAGTPIDAPDGYTVTVTLEDIHTKVTYTLLSGKIDQSGENTYVWRGVDADGNPLPDGFYYWRLSAMAPTVRFQLPPAKEGGAPIIKSLTAPSYAEEKQMILLDRHGPELIGIHPLGGGRIAVEARDRVGGLRKLQVEGGAAFAKEWPNDQPLRSAVSLVPGEGETIRVILEDAAGNRTEDALPLQPYVAGTGDADSLPHVESAVAGQQVRINLTTGNGMQKFNGFTQERPGADLDFYLTYNHQNRLQGKMGYGWSFSLDSRLTKWPDGNITWTGFDGTLYWFKPAGKNQYVTYANGQQQYYPKLTFDPDSSSADRNAFIMEWPNQLRYRFHNDGRFWLIQDRYTTEMSFVWEEVATYYGYDYRIEKVFDIERNEVVTFQYQSGEGNLASTVIADIDGLGNELEGNKRKFFFMYNQAGEFVGYRDPSQKIIRFVYDDLHRVVKIIDNGNNLREEEGATPDSVTTVWTYDEQNRLVRIGMKRKQDGVDEFISVAYGNQEATVEQPLGKFTLRWDDAGRPTERVETVRTDQGDRQAVTQYAYSGNNLIRVTDPLGRITRYRYNDADLIEAEQSPSGRIVHYQYDEALDLIGITGPLGYRIDIELEKDFRRILKRTTTQRANDPAGVIEAGDIVTIETFNQKGELVERTDGNGNTFVYRYDENGFLLSDGTRTSYENDRNGNRTSIIMDEGTPDEAITRQTFNAVGWLMHRESPTGLIEDFEYDAWGRKTKEVARDADDPSKELTRVYRYDDGGNLIEESDGLTRTTYEYDGMGNLLSRTTEPLKAGTEGVITEKYAYDSRGLVTEATDSRGLVTKTSYNLAGDPVRIELLPSGNVTTIEYDTAGRRKTVIEADGGRTDYEYDLWDRVIKEKQLVKPVFPGNIVALANSGSGQIAVTSYRYDTAGRQIEKKDPTGSWERTIYDGNGQVIETVIGGPIPQWNGKTLGTGTADTLYEGHEVLQRRQYAYDKLGRLLRETDGNGNAVEYRYEGRTVETLTPAFDENGNEVVYKSKEFFDPSGRLVRKETASGEVAMFEYDAFGNEVQSVNEEGQTIKSTVDVHGRLLERTEEIDASGAVQKTVFQVDAWGNVTEESLQLSDGEWAITRYVFSPEGDLLEETGPTGLVTKYEYDELGLLRRETELNDLGNETYEERVTSYDYDAMGRLISTSRPDGSRKQTVYDTLGNELLSIDGLGNIIEYRYDAGERLTEVITYDEGATDLDESSISTLTRGVYDGAGNIVLVKDPNGNLIRYFYDAGGDLISEIHYADPSMAGAQIVNTYQYDPRGLLVAWTDGNGHTTTYGYDAEGQLIIETDPVGQWTRFEYSPAGYVTAERRPLGRDIEWVYDYRGNLLEEKNALGNTRKFTLDLDGRVTTEFNRMGEPTQYGYDAAGRMTEQVMPYGGRYQYRYDAAGNLLEEVRPVYGTVRYDYDLRDNLTKVVEPKAGTGKITTSYTYDAELNRTSQQDGKTQLTSYDYDELGRRLQKVVVRPESGQDVFEYQYDPNGNLVMEKKPGGLKTLYTYDFMNRVVFEEYSDGTWYAYTYDKANNMLTRTGRNGTIFYSYYANNQLKSVAYPNGDTIVYEYNENGEKSAEIVNGVRTEFEMDPAGRPKTYTDSKGYAYEYEYDADGYMTEIRYPNGIVTSIAFKPGHLIGAQRTTRSGEELHASEYTHNDQAFIIGIKEQGDVSGYHYNDREQLERIETAEGDVIVYEYDEAGNRTVRKAIIQGTVEDKNTIITTDELVLKVLESFGMNPGKPAKGDPGNGSRAPVCQDPGKGNGNNGENKGNGGNGKGNGKKSEVSIASANGNGRGRGNEGGNGNPGGSDADHGNSGGNHGHPGNGNSSGEDHVNNGKSGGDHGKGNGNGKGIGNEKGKGNANGNDNNGKGNGGGCGWLKALENGNGKKLGLYKKLGTAYGDINVETMFETGQLEHILAAIDQIVNEEVNLPPGGHEKLFERIREVGRGYTVIGTNYTYNARNQLIHRENLIRYEEYEYVYDDQGNLLTDGRSQYEWNALGQLVKVTFPDGSGESYAYDMLGRRISKTQFNHRGETQEVTNYKYKGDTWTVIEETDKFGEVTKSYTFDVNERPLTITYKGETYWYVYNGHGDVIALTDKDGNVAARYEYDAWGLVTGMYNRFGERVREGIGWIGDLGTGNGSPGSVQGPEDESGNTEPDDHPGNGNSKDNGNGNNGHGNGNGNGKNKGNVSILSLSMETEATTESAADSIDADLSDSMITAETEPTDDITTELVKENPYRYAGYYWDRKTQFYYLQARYYDPRSARFISEDTYEGELNEPTSLNLYTYAMNNPLMYIDPTGHIAWYQYDDLGLGVYDSLRGTISGLLSWSTYKGLYELGRALYKGEISFIELGTAVVGSAVEPYNYVIRNTYKVFGGKPSNKEVRKYGQNLGEVLISFAGSAKAMGLISKVAPSLAKKLSIVKGKRSLKSSCNCFTAGTKVLTDEGEKPIEEIEVGDKVLAKSDETGEVAYKEVVGLFQKQADEIYYVHIGDEIIEVTGEHPFWLDGKGWTLVKDLKVGDLLVSSDGSKLAIDKIDKEPREATVYNFEVADFNSYFVSNLGIWVHNCTVLNWTKDRIEHVNLHGKNDLQKKLHGVFYGDPVSVVNKAWQNKGDVKPISQGNRDVYHIPYSNAGYQGGYAGQGQNLNYVTIVVDRKTGNIVTGYPSYGK